MAMRTGAGMSAHVKKLWWITGTNPNTPSPAICATAAAAAGESQ